MLEYTKYSPDIKAINTFDRNIELANGLETDYLRLFYYEFDHYYKNNYKSYEYYKLCTIFKGSKHVVASNKVDFIHNKNEFVVIPPYLTVSVEVQESCHGMVFEISDILLDKIRNKVCIRKEFEGDPMESERHPLSRGNSEFIQTDIEKIISTAFGVTKDKEFLIDLYAQEMIYKLLNCLSSNIILEKNNKHSINRAIELMKTGCTDNMDLSEIAHSVNMSPALFSMKFKKITGLAPNIYYTNIKLNEAKKMLKFKTVTEVAYDLGYDNISHFIRLFFEKFRFTPKQYQLQFYTNVV
ncbi:MAG: helix-turn-helix transcriptional regulator [Spirochaetes bacterium]|nr:helix-turn-helix transcriptional regulator [Spirochaetota bacterium]